VHIYSTPGGLYLKNDAKFPKTQDNNFINLNYELLQGRLKTHLEKNSDTENLNRLNELFNTLAYDLFIIFMYNKSSPSPSSFSYHRFSFPWYFSS
jgi:hypothetical protein